MFPHMLAALKIYGSTHCCATHSGEPNSLTIILPLSPDFVIHGSIYCLEKSISFHDPSNQYRYWDIELSPSWGIDCIRLLFGDPVFIAKFHLGDS